MSLDGSGCVSGGCERARAGVHSGGGGPLVDGPDSTGSNFNESAFTITVAGEGGVVTSINSVTLTNVTHTFLGDLQIVLRGPDGIAQANLLSSPDNEASDLGGTYVFVVDAGVPTLPEAALTVSGTTAVDSGTYAISGYLDANNPGPRTTYDPLVGQNADGVWTLGIRDYYTNDVGDLGSWSLNLTSSVPEPGSATVLALAGAGLLARRSPPRELNPRPPGI